MGPHAHYIIYCFYQLLIRQHRLEEIQSHYHHLLFLPNSRRNGEELPKNSEEKAKIEKNSEAKTKMKKFEKFNRSEDEDEENNQIYGEVRSSAKIFFRRKTEDTTLEISSQDNKYLEGDYSSTAYY